MYLLLPITDINDNPKNKCDNHLTFLIKNGRNTGALFITLPFLRNLRTDLIS